MSRLDEAIDRAGEFLSSQAELGFADARHEMSFPRWAGFTAASERQCSDVFARAVLGSVLVDIAELEGEAGDGRFTRLARREADHVAEHRLRDRPGGWSYFPGLPELPPDLDSLGAALHLFARARPQHVSLCAEPVRWVLENFAADGSVSTWIIAPTCSPSDRSTMERGVRRYWGATTDVEVCARFFLALESLRPRSHDDLLRKGAQLVLSRQEPDGHWNATWYWGPFYGTSLCIRLLRALDVDGAGVHRGLDFLRRSQREDGGWGFWQSVPLDTALALWTLARHASGDEDRLRRAAELLLEHQNPDGSWVPTPWIKMDVGRAFGRVWRTLTHGSAAVTTAFGLRALVALRTELDHRDASGAGASLQGRAEPAGLL